MQRGFYVDDGLQSAQTANDAISLIQRTSTVLREGGFRLHKFLSKSPAILQALPGESVISDVNQVDLGDIPAEVSLGILWNDSEDS